MKLRIKFFLVTILILAGASMLLRPNPQPSGTAEGAETRAETTPVRVSAPATPRPRAPLAIPSDLASLPSFTEYVRTYTDYSEQELAAAEASVNRELDDGPLIARANTGRVTDAERTHLTTLLRMRNAIYAVKTQRLVATVGN